MAAKVKINYTQLFINNEFVNSVSGKTFPTYNPATEEIIAQVQEGDKEDIDLAVKAARKAIEIGSEWRSMTPADRGALIRKFSDLIKRDAESLAKLETLNNGKPNSDSLGDIGYTTDCLDYYAGWTDKITGKSIPVDENHLVYTRHEPVGVCGLIIPWNYPLLMMAWKFGPALACGNTVILKPAEQTPLTALAVAALAKEAGFPPGVINVVPGYGTTAGHALAMHMDVNKIAFTGSTVVGHKIQEASAKSNLKRVSLELGGKSPFIIFDLDDDKLEEVANIIAEGMFGNQGQSCCAPSRAFVHESVYEKYLEKMKRIAESKVVGDPFDEHTTNGAIISEAQYKKVLAYIQSGKDEGARCITGGEKYTGKGYFVRPTVFADVTDSMKIAKEEIFGPVLSVFKFSDMNEALRRMNATPYGLAAGIFTNDISKIFPLAHAIEAGSVWVNCYDSIFNQAPFGGFKMSGFGRELGEYGLHEYTEVKNVTIKFQ